MNTSIQKWAMTFGVFFFISQIALGQSDTNTEVVDGTIWTFVLENMILISGFIVFIIACLFILNSTLLIIKIQQKNLLIEQGIIDTNEYEVKESKFSFQNIMTYLSGLKPIAQEKHVDIGHSFDGISELDNSLPPWWLD